MRMINNWQIYWQKVVWRHRDKIYQTKVDQLQYQIDFQDRKMDDIKDEMAMLNGNDVDDKKGIKETMEGLHEWEKKFNRWEELTSAETARREGVEVEWDGLLGAFDNSTELL